MNHHQVLKACLLRNQRHRSSPYRTDPVQEEMTTTLAFGVSNLVNFCLRIKFFNTVPSVVCWSSVEGQRDLKDGGIVHGGMAWIA
ncbi:unnamed protein product [Brassica napus]|uniref:(rape) hypothetical protein n=1 Tax=Brassica napus TaxID=3708 RepID=A0A816I0U1_BRANA|nr:unnamed protein product [Brassica napus]